MKKRVYRPSGFIVLTVLLIVCKGLVLQAFAFDDMGVVYDCGDRTFFHSDYISDITDSYGGCTVGNNGAAYEKNSVIFNRCGENRYDPNRTDNSIHLIKDSRYDCFFDVTNLTAYPYYLVRGRAKTDAAGADLRLCSFKAAVDSSLRIFNTLNITPAGQLTAADGTVLGTVSEGVWFSYAVAFDLNEHKAELYIGGVLRHTVALDERIKELALVRFWIYHDDKENDPLDGIRNGDVYFDGLEVTGMRLPYTGDETNYSSVLYDDAPVKEYLTGKTAYHTENGCVFSGGEKTFPAMTLRYEEKTDELYGDYRALNAGFGFQTAQSGDAVSEERISITEDGLVVYGGRVRRLTSPVLREGRELLLPLKELAECVLGKYSFQDGFGVFIFSDTRIDLDLASELPEYMTPLSTVYPHTDIKSINWYLAFERPSALTIKRDFEKNRPGHPRLLADAGTFDYIRSEYRRLGSNIKTICADLLPRADAVIGLDAMEYELPDRQRLLTISREMVRRMEYLGFAYQVTGETKYVEAAWKNLVQVLNYPDWNPSHMIDVGEMNYAVALAYDWMYDGFTEEQRGMIYEGVREHGMEVTRLCYYGRVPNWGQWANKTDAFVQWKSNFNAVINGGALAAAMAFAERDPEFCFDIAEKAVRSLEYTMIGFAPDGAWIEGANYWEYTMSYLSKGVGAMMTALGTDYGLMNCSGAEESAMWYRSLCSFQGSNNFHDAGFTHFSYAQFPWLSNVYGFPPYAETRRAAIKRGSAYTVYDALWYQPGISSEESGYLLYASFGGIESVTARGSFSDETAMYFSAHAGQVFCYHSQADAGAFIFDALGQRWACDLGAENYDVQRDGGLKYYGSYRRRAEAHNVTVINPNTDDGDGGQKNDAFVPLVRAEETSYGSFTEYDMTPAYSEYAEFYRRQFHTHTDAQTLVVTDVIDLKEAAEVCWFMTTEAEVSWTDAARFVLTRNGKTMYGSIDIGCTDFSTATTACGPLLGAPVLEGQNINAGFSRIVIRARAEGLLKIRVTLSPDRDFDPYCIPDVKDYIVEEFAVYGGETPLEDPFRAGGNRAVARGYFYGDSGRPVLTAALYDSGGRLQEAATGRAIPRSGSLTELSAELQAGTLERSTFKAFLWDERQRPLCAPITLEYR